MEEKKDLNYIKHLVSPDKAAEFFHFFSKIIGQTPYQLVRLKISGKEELKIQIMAEDQNKSMVIEDCKILSNLLVDTLDSSDDFAYEYTLEVSSPGIDRPLTCKEDFDFWIDNKVFVKLKKPLNNNKKLTGILKGAVNKSIKLDYHEINQLIEIDIENIKDINILWSPETDILN